MKWGYGQDPDYTGFCWHSEYEHIGAFAQVKTNQSWHGFCKWQEQIIFYEIIQNMTLENLNETSLWNNELHGCILP